MRKHSFPFCAVTKVFSIFLFFVMLCPLLIYGQTINVIKISGNTAEISEGTGGGINDGDRVKVSRMVNGAWLEITTAEVKKSGYVSSTIKIPDGSALVKLGDKVEEILLPPIQKSKNQPVEIQTKSRSSTIESANKSANTSSKNSAATTRKNMASRPARKQTSLSPSYQSLKRVYLGPQIGAFIPVGDMTHVFENTFGYGGIVGAQFRKNLDICIQFFFAAKKNNWSFWNLQMLGRRYLNSNILFDFGYGIAYPEFITNGFSGGGNIQLGLTLGLTYVAPLSNNMWFEIGGLFQYYPNFGKKSGQFITLQGRLLL